MWVQICDVKTHYVIHLRILMFLKSITQNVQSLTQEVRAFNLGTVTLGCVPTPEESCHWQTSSTDPPAGLHLHPAGSFPNPDKVKLILPGWALTFCPSTATTQRSWGTGQHSMPAASHGMAGVSLRSHRWQNTWTWHNCVVPWDVQPVGAHSIHPNHQSYISVSCSISVIFSHL